jgi:aminoglycoside phosphotransferase
MIHAEPVGPLTRAEASAVLRDACEVAGLQAEGAALLRLGENAIFRLAHDRVVVRIARGLDVLPDARKEVAVAAWLADTGLSAAHTTRTSQPLTVRGHPVTFWQCIDDTGAKATTAELGTMLRRLHALQVPDSLHLPELEIFGRVAERITAARIADAERSFLARRLDTLRAQYQDLGFALTASAVHGDAHQGNLIKQPDGTAVMIDLERFAFGPPETDLSVTATEYLIGWHTGEQYADFVRAYSGYDVMTWPGFPVVRAINELKMTTWLMQNISESDGTAIEFRTRLASLRDPGGPRRWEPF